jgi:hydrogenase nickel incorporation protein HypB
MCTDCGCEEVGRGAGASGGSSAVEETAPTRAEPARIAVESAVLAKNDALAVRTRTALRARGILALNFLSAPGAGKTTLLERLILDLTSEPDPVPMAVIEGDQETDRDAARIRAAGCRAVQINTGPGCHLDAERVAAAVRELAPRPASLLLIENVGNLVCPAMFDLGERAKVVVLSVTEGEDKPLKYPHAFRAAEALVLTKTDLLAHLDFDLEACVENARRVNPRLRIFPVSARRGEGLGDFEGWLRERLARASEESAW